MIKNADLINNDITFKCGVSTKNYSHYSRDPEPRIGRREAEGGSYKWRSADSVSHLPLLRTRAQTGCYR